MLVSRIDEVLAQTDPYELAQAVERYVGTLPGDRIIALLLDAQGRLGPQYRDQFLSVLGSDADEFAAALAQPWSDSALQHAFTSFLQSNLRAIPIFGTAFGMAVLARTPGDRAVAIGEERSNRGTRGLILAGTALALVLAGAAGEHVIAGARSAAQTPEPVVAMPQAVSTPVPPSAAPSNPSTTPPKARVVARAATEHSAAPPTAQPQATPAPSPVQAPPVQAPEPPPPQAASVQKKRLPTNPPAKPGPVVVVTAPPQTPSPQPSDLDVTDMPESYTDATPLPDQTPATAQPAVRSVKLVTPTPAPKHHSWLHRTVMHLDPFKPNPRPT